jgi:hypothetical protein
MIYIQNLSFLYLFESYIADYVSNKTTGIGFEFFLNKLIL